MGAPLNERVTISDDERVDAYLQHHWIRAPIKSELSKADLDALREKIYLEQGSCCAICKSTDPGHEQGWCLDHDHVSGIVRGVLCHACNVAHVPRRENALSEAHARLNRPVEITDELLKNFKLGPTQNRARIWDTKLQGFGVVIGKRRVSFVVQRRIKGSRTHTSITLGHWSPDELDVESARVAASKALGQMRRGVNPRASR